MPSELQRVAQELLNALDEIPRVMPYLHDRASKYREAAAWVGSFSSNPHARMAAMQLDEAARRCEEAAHYLSMAPPRARGWVEQMVSGVRTAEPAGDSTARRPDGPGTGEPPAEGRRGDDQAEPEAGRSGKPTDAGDEARPGDGPHGLNPEEFRPRASEILRRLPVRGRRAKTRGAWVDADGHEHDLISGVDEYTADAERFMNENNIQIAPGDITLGSHVEVKFAMFMRKRGLTDEIITINNRPCPGPYGCDENLFRFLPDGARLTVFGPAGFKRTYPRRDEDT